MSLTSWLKGRTKETEEFTRIIRNATPSKEKFKSISGNKPNEYKMLVPYNLTNHNFAGFVGTTFDYLARFRIARILNDEKATHSLVAATGFQRLLANSSTSKVNLKFEHYTKMIKQVINYINRKTDDKIELLIPIASRLAYLEDIARGNRKLNQINIFNVLNGEPKEEIINELLELLNVFEERFILSGIINESSEVIYNPHFGVSSALVDGADADIFIDGTLYDFKTSKKKDFSFIDAEQLIGYYLLNQLSMRVDSNDIGYPYEMMDIERVAFYRARFGEIEYFDISELPITIKSDAIQQLAAYFIGKTDKLRFNLWSDIDKLESYLKIFA